MVISICIWYNKCFFLQRNRKNNRFSICLMTRTLYEVYFLNYMNYFCNILSFLRLYLNILRLKLYVCLLS